MIGLILSVFLVILLIIYIISIIRFLLKRDFILFTVYCAFFLILFGLSVDPLYSQFLLYVPSPLRSQLDEYELAKVDEAKKLIQSVDKNIFVSDINVYNAKLLSKDTTGFFSPNEITGELCIFIDFDKAKKCSDDYVFEVIVHEMIHSQHYNQNYKNIFDNNFNEGLTQYYTEWLIENYSDLHLINHTYDLQVNIVEDKIHLTYKKFNVYSKQVEDVEILFDENQIDNKESFIHYLNFDQEYFRNFVPVEYFN